MKKIFFLVIFLYCWNSYSQAITVSTTAYSVPDLVNNILINSPCITATNINWSTGTNFGSTNGIGYFSSTNANFPIQSGVILSTGNAAQAVGPNNMEQGSGSDAWPGDADLEVAMSSAGIPLNSKNATWLQFDFTPLSTYFDFNFLFASEEYGNFQCQFSDSFAFLITNLNTGITTNLAVIPGTTIPISVVTIRDALYNSNCTSQNSQYFGSYNGGTNAASSATNFNGQTVLMNASTVLTPNTPYRIKLVIADRTDFRSDSAIFLASNSFNIGQAALGPDLLVATNNAVCPLTTHTITSGLSPSLYTFSWKKDGNLLVPAQTGPDLVISTPGVYELTYTNNSLTCQPAIDEITVQYYPAFTTAATNALYACINSSGIYNFNLSLNTPAQLALLPAGTTVSYFSNMTDATNNTNPLPNNVSTVGLFYTRITNGATGCFVIKSFSTMLTPEPVAIRPTNGLTNCEVATIPNKAFFNLNSLRNTILNNQSQNIYTLSFHASIADATARINPLNTAVHLSLSTTVYAVISVRNSSPVCISNIVPISLIVKPILPVDTMPNIVYCNSYTLPALTNGNYFEGSNGTGTPRFAGESITETTVLYIYNANLADPNDCPNQTSFRITIVSETDLLIASGTYCDSYSLPPLTFGSYRTAPNGGGTIIPAGTVITTSQTVYFYYAYTGTAAPQCEINPPGYVISIINVNQVPVLANVFDCSAYTLQPLSFGNYFNAAGQPLAVGTTLNSSQTITISGQTASCPPSVSTFQVVIGLDYPLSITTCTPYTLPPLAVGGYYNGPNGTGGGIPQGSIISATKTIYVYVGNVTAPNCTDNFNFTVTITSPEIIVPDTNSNNQIISCGPYVLQPLNFGNYYEASGGTGTPYFAGNYIDTNIVLYAYFNDTVNGCFNEKMITITINPIPPIDARSSIDDCNSYTFTQLTNGKYYSETNGGGTEYIAGQSINTTQTVYIYAINSFGCKNESSFTITIHPAVAYNPPSSTVTACDSYTLPAIPIGNQYFTQPGGTGVEKFAGDIIVNSQTLYIYLRTIIRSDLYCDAENQLDIVINSTPVLAPVTAINACNSYTLPPLTIGNYYNSPNGLGLITNLTLTNSQKVYVYAETTTVPNCFDQDSFDVTIYNVDEIQDVVQCTSYTLPILTNGNYYTATGGVGFIPAGTIITNSASPTTLFIYGTSGFSPSCSDESSFIITIVPTPIANAVPASLTTVCDEDGTNDGVTNFDLALLDATIKGTQTGPEFSVSYYNSAAQAITNANPILTTTNSIAYARLANANAPDCYAILPITIVVNKLPETTVRDGIVCIDSETNTLLKAYTIDSGLTAATHSFQWFNSAGNIVGTSRTYTAITPGIYSIIATNVVTGCASEENFSTVAASEPAEITLEVSNEFTNNQSITVIASGVGGNYVYQLDDGIFQSSNVFFNVIRGFHTITVSDLNGCGDATTETVVINYPKYFTPNGDGIHDTWNIFDLYDDNSVKISIYDRFGKLITEISTASNGWDGTYNGRQMPSEDYWFSLDYSRNNIQKNFKAHFSLKR
jgi:gliding motility-associated-like protein